MQFARQYRPSLLRSSIGIGGLIGPDRDPEPVRSFGTFTRPGRNVTGFTGLEFSLGGKWMDLLKQIAPSVTRAAYLFHPEMEPFYARWLESVEPSAAALGIEVIALPVRAVADIEPASKPLQVERTMG
jgi:putative tryptophan/tyrosine transport system substrate-binding protein